MGVLEEETRQRITKLLKRHPKGLMISDLATRLKINRNVMAKYLEMLLIAGDVEMDERGNARIFTLSQRIPVFALLENSSDYVILLDSAARILQVNAPVLCLAGMKGNNVTGRKCRDVDHPFFQALPCQENPETAGQVREVSCTVGGNTLSFRIRQNPVVFGDGNRGIVLVCEDVTGELRHRELLALSEARFRAIIEDQTEFIVRFLPDGTPTFLNGSFARFLGTEQDAIPAISVTAMISSEDLPQIRQSIRALGRMDPVTELEFRIMDREGKIHWQAWTIRALFNGTESVSEYQGVGRDITGRFEADALAGRHAADLEFLSRKAREFIHLPPGPAVHRKILKDVSEIIPDALMSLSIFDPLHHVLTVRAAYGKDLEGTFRTIFGFDLVGLSFHVTDPTVLTFLKGGELHKIHGGLYSGFFCQVPVEACIRMEEAMDMGDMFAFGFTTRDLLLGNIAIVIRKGGQLPSPRLLGAYLCQASLAIALHAAADSPSEGGEPVPAGQQL